MTATDTQASILSAQKHVASKNYEAAVRLLTAHLQQVPGDVEALNLLGLTYFQAGRIADAKSTYLRMWSVEPTDYRAVFGTGMALAKLQEFNDAERWLEATLALNPDFERAAKRLSEMPATRAAAQSKPSGVAGSTGGPSRPRLTTLSLPDNAEDLEEYRMSSRQRARIDTMNQHWYGIPWPVRVIQVIGLVIFIYVFVQAIAQT